MAVRTERPRPPGRRTSSVLLALLLLATPIWAEEPVRPTYGDVAVCGAPKGQFYVWYRGALADQPVRDAMQQYLTGVVLPELARVLDPKCTQALSWAFRGEGGALDVIYRRLGNVYENLASIWSIGPNGRNYSNDVTALEKFQACLNGEAEMPAVHMGIRDVLCLSIVKGHYVRLSAPIVQFPHPTPNEQIGKRAPVNVRLSFPPKGAGLDLLNASDSAHAAASGIGMFPLSVDAAAKAYEANASTRDELHFRQMKRFTGYCDPRWGSENCTKWKGVQHKFFHMWTLAEKAGNWRDARNADSDHQLAHICTNVRNSDLDVRFSVPGVDEHEWPIMNCETALEKLG